MIETRRAASRRPVTVYISPGSRRSLSQKWSIEEIPYVPRAAALGCGIDPRSAVHPLLGSSKLRMIVMSTRSFLHR